MTIFKRSLFLALTTYLVVFIDRLTWYFSARQYFRTWQFYVVPFALVAAGLILGWLSAMIIQHSKWIKSFYLLGLNTTGIALVILVLYRDVQPWFEGWYKATHPSGKYAFSDFEGLRGSDIARGFDKFYESMPGNPRIDFLGYLFTNQAVPGKANDTTWTLYYCYRFYPDSSTARISKVELHKGRVRVLAYNQPALADSAYCRLAQEYNEDKIKKIIMMMDITSLSKDLSRDSILIRQSAEKQLRDTFPR